MTSVFRKVLGLQHTVIEGVRVERGDVIVVVRPAASQRQRCGRCGKRSRPFDTGGGRRRWRTLDVGIARCYLEAPAPRVCCREHGPTVAAVPWARHDAGHTRVFDDTVVWLATRASKSTVARLLRLQWRTVGAIMTRVWEDLDDGTRLDGVCRIGIDEFSFKRGQKYVTVVVDHDRQRVIWMAEGRNAATIHQFFNDLGPDRTAQLTHVSADGAQFIDRVVAERCPAAIRCADPFHVVGWATKALDDVRRDLWNEHRRLSRDEPKRRRGRERSDQPAHRPHTEAAKIVKGSRFALWKNPENLSDYQRQKLQWIQICSPRLHRAYQLKEGLRAVLKLQPDDADHGLTKWLAWAQRSRIPQFVELARTIRRHRDRIMASIDHQLNNALVESTNAKARMLTRVAYGFHSAEALIATTMLALGGLELALPGR